MTKCDKCGDSIEVWNQGIIIVDIKKIYTELNPIVETKNYHPFCYTSEDA